ncbi:MAG: SCO1664 family protein [Dehalococcoidia bacterium]
MERFPTSSWSPDRADIETLLVTSAVSDSGLIPSASNYVFLVELESESAGTGYAVYKPLRGETLLWDFPPDLYKREVASYVVSQALGWRLVPPTVPRDDGLEHGLGSLQLYIPSDQHCTFFDLRDEHADAMRRFATFDWLVNNADRKGGHVLLDADGHVWGIDNALTFHTEEKLRTVIWDYAGEEVPESLLPDIERLLGQLEPECELWQRLEGALEGAELEMLRERARAVLRERRFPHPPDWRRPYPWPLI